MAESLLVLTTTYPRWAGDTLPAFVHELCKRLAVNRRVIVLAPHCKGAATREVLDGVEVRRFRYAPERFERLCYGAGMLGELRQSRWLKLLLPVLLGAFMLNALGLVWRHNIRWLHAHWLLPQGLIAAMVCRLSRAQFIVTAHGADVFALTDRVALGLKRWVGAQAVVVAGVSTHVLQTVCAQGLRGRHTICAPMGVDVEQRFRLRDAAPDAGGALFVGRLVEKKGLMVLLNAYAALPAQFQARGLTVVGDGPERAAGERFVAERALPNVRWLGAKEPAAIPAFLRDAAVFVAPFQRSRDGDEEGLGLVVAEAMACGVPVIVSDMAATQDLAIPGETALVVPQGDDGALSAAIESSYTNPADAADRAQRARLHVDRHFSWERCAERYQQVLTGTG
jgi:glycosyltransferase involved in cell wall biosynthesis